MKYRQQPASSDCESDTSSVITVDPSALSLINAVLVDLGLAFGVLWIGSSLLVLMIFSLIALGFSTSVPLMGHDYFAISLMFFLCGLIGYMVRQGARGPVGLVPDAARTPLRCYISCPLIAIAFFLMVGVYVFMVGASISANYIISLVVIGMPFSMGLASFNIVGALRPRVKPPLAVPLAHYRSARFAVPMGYLVILLMLWGLSALRRSSVLDQAIVPTEYDAIHGIWEMVAGNEATAYTSFQMHPGPGPPEDYQHFSNHAIGSRVVGTFVATPVDFDEEALACAHTRGHPGYLILLHDNGVLGFTGMIFNTTGFVANATKRDSPSLDELVCFAKSEDKRLTVLNVLHGALHGCFCFGIFTDGQTLQRYNRYSWDTGIGWKAVRKRAAL